jgi:hypothetical protein
MTEAASEKGGGLGLLGLVPLVKVAWAEGRVTRRERALIEQAARLHGVEAGGAAGRLLSGWLDARPSREFFDQSLARLRSLLRALPGDGRDAATLDLLSLCTQVAEASGGSNSFAAGGRRICDEEVATVKRVAAELSHAAAGDGDGLLRLSEATGVTDAGLLRELLAAGYTRETGALLPLAPLVETAWAEGRVSAHERKLVLTAARLRGVRPGAPAHEMLARLLDEEPPAEFFEASRRALKSVMNILPPDLRRVEELDLLAACERVAAASGEEAGRGWRDRKVCDQERGLLDRLASEFGAAGAG